MELKEQIIKAIIELRVHGLDNGGTIGYHAGWCDDVADRLANALSLIKELTEDNESLKTQRRVLAVGLKDLRQEIKETKADTVRKMQTEIASRCIKGGIYPAFVERTIDQVAKEMLEGEK